MYVSTKKWEDLMRDSGTGINKKNPKKGTAKRGIKTLEVIQRLREHEMFILNVGLQAYSEFAGFRLIARYIGVNSYKNDNQNRGYPIQEDRN